MALAGDLSGSQRRHCRAGWRSCLSLLLLDRFTLPSSRHKEIIPVETKMEGLLLSKLWAARWGAHEMQHRSAISRRDTDSWHEECQAGTKRATTKNKYPCLRENRVYDVYKVVLVFVGKVCSRGGFLEGLVQMDPERHFDSGMRLIVTRRCCKWRILWSTMAVSLNYCPNLAKRLQQVASFEIASFSLYDPEKKIMRMHFWEGGERLSGQTEFAPVEESACGFVLEKQQAMVWPDLHRETRFRPAVRLLAGKGVRSYCTLPLTTAQRGSGRWGWEVLAPTRTARMICVFCRELRNWWPWLWKTR